MNSPTQPNDHVLDLVLDYLEGRLDPDRTDEVRQHLRGCDDCRQDFEHASALRGATIEAELRHIHSHRIVELADGLHPTVHENQHLDACETCRRELEWSGDLDLPVELLEEGPAPVETRRGLFGLPLPVVQWGSVLAAAAVLVVLTLPRGDDALRSLADVRALPVEVDVTRAASTAMDRGLTAYADADYRTSQAEFQRAVREEAGYAEAYLYLGSSQLHLGEVASAIQNLAQAIQSTDTDELDRTGAAAHYLLGNAYLLQGREGYARSNFERVITLDGLFVPEAREQLEKMDSAD